MKTLSDFIFQHGIKLIIFLKVTVLSYVLFDQSWLEIGERSLNANETSSASTQANTKEPDVEEVSEKTGSAIDELLNLPNINADRLRKDEIARYISLIERKKSQAEDRIRFLQQREMQLKRLEGQVNNKLQKLEEEMQYFQQTQQQEKTVQDERLAKLVEFYEKMNPKKAAPVFERLDRDLVVQLFKRIPQKQTREILSLIEPEHSVELSEYFGRIRSAK
ncbi:MAG: MotE family protein [Oligoflexus sp.]